MIWIAEKTERRVIGVQWVRREIAKKNREVGYLSQLLVNSPFRYRVVGTFCCKFAVKLKDS
jgi:hypothetical protein